jgi:hypothetical protein
LSNKIKNIKYLHFIYSTNLTTPSYCVTYIAYKRNVDCSCRRLAKLWKEVVVTQYCASGKIEKNEMGGACGAYGGGERCAQVVGGEA